jgi:hypothetical protein
MNYIYGASVLWAYAIIGQTDQRSIFFSFAPTVKLNMSRYNSQDLANIGWAYPVANIAFPLFFDSEFISTCLAKEGYFTMENHSQLCQRQLWQEELKSDVRLPLHLHQWSLLLSNFQADVAFESFCPLVKVQKTSSLLKLVIVWMHLWKWRKLKLALTWMVHPTLLVEKQREWHLWNADKWVLWARLLLFSCFWGSGTSVVRTLGRSRKNRALYCCVLDSWFLEGSYTLTELDSHECCLQKTWWCCCFGSREPVAVMLTA